MNPIVQVLVPMIDRPRSLYSLEVAYAEALASGRHVRASLIADGTIVPAGCPGAVREGCLHMRGCDFEAALCDCIEGEWGALEMPLRLYADPTMRPLVR